MRGKMKGASLLEAVVAAVLFMLVFMMIMELLPRFTIREDDTLLIAEAESGVACAFGKYGSGLWPNGEYAEKYDWGEVAVRIGPYKEFGELQLVEVAASIEANGRCIQYRQVVVCGE